MASELKWWWWWLFFLACYGGLVHCPRSSAAACCYSCIAHNALTSSTSGFTTARLLRTANACGEWWRLLRRPPGLHRLLCRAPAESAGELPSFSRNPTHPQEGLFAFLPSRLLSRCIRLINRLTGVYQHDHLIQQSHCLHWQFAHTAAVALFLLEVLVNAAFK